MGEKWRGDRPAPKNEKVQAAGEKGRVSEGCSRSPGKEKGGIKTPLPLKKSPKG